MTWLEIGFWICLGIFLYTYLVYPILLAILAKLFGKPRNLEPFSTTVSILLPVHNEATNLKRRLEEFTSLFVRRKIQGAVYVISDASTDDSVSIANSFENKNVIVLEQRTKQGKAAALNRAAEVSNSDLLIFADARQRWSEDALELMMRNFSDPKVGAVTGDLVLESGPGVLAGVGAYWKFEKWLRQMESKLDSQVGVTGAIAAVRRTLYTPIPGGTILDDVFWPMHVVLKGYRVVNEPEAKAFDHLPEKAEDEFRRKVRTLSGNFQLFTRLPFTALLPFGNRIWWQFFSHKFCRLLVPWAMLGMLLSSFLTDKPFYSVFFWVQIAGYLLAFAGLITFIGKKVKLLGTAASFFVLNLAAFVSFWVWITGRAGKSWHKAQYQAQISADV